MHRKAETDHFKGVPLLPTFGAHDMMELPSVISESQFACAAMRCLEIGEEGPDIRKGCDSIAHLDPTTNVSKVD